MYEAISHQMLTCKTQLLSLTFDLHVTCSIVFIALYFPLVETIPAPPLQYSFPHIPPIVEPKVTKTESDRNPSTN